MAQPTIARERERERERERNYLKRVAADFFPCCVLCSAVAVAVPVLILLCHSMVPDGVSKNFCALWISGSF